MARVKQTLCIAYYGLPLHAKDAVFVLVVVDLAI
jgi:hypothetical protein